MRILFMGTPEIAVSCLEALADSEFTLCGVFTQPDRPKGRGMKMTPPPVKAFAEAIGLPVFQPAKIRGSMELVERLTPDLIAVMAYGKILPKAILDYPKFGCINVHASLLPKYRGAAPIQAAIAAGETMGGLTTMHMAERLDSGDMIYQETVAISPSDTGGSLHDRYAALGGPLLLKTVRALLAGTAPRVPQNEAEATYAPAIQKEDAAIDWHAPVKEILNRIRAYNPWPVAYSSFGGTPMKVYAAESGGECPDAIPGTTIHSGPAGIEVAALDGIVRITELQVPGKRKMSAAEFLRGNAL